MQIKREGSATARPRVYTLTLIRRATDTIRRTVSGIDTLTEALVGLIGNISRAIWFLMIDARLRSRYMDCKSSCGNY
jgi:hypothetical protein